MKAGRTDVLAQPGTADADRRPRRRTMVYPTAYYPAAVSARRRRPIALRPGDERAASISRSSRARGSRIWHSRRPRRPVGHDRRFCSAWRGADEATDPIEAATTMTDCERRVHLCRACRRDSTCCASVRVPRPPVNVEEMTRDLGRARSGTMTISGRRPRSRRGAAADPGRRDARGADAARRRRWRHDRPRRAAVAGRRA